MRRRCRTRGFTLTEALVALVVLSAGLVGMAALQARALALARAAQLQSHAVDLAADMAERIRANRQGRDSYAAAGDRGCGTERGKPLSCTPAETAAHEAFLWQQQVRRLLPNGSAEIRRDAEEAAPAAPRYVIDLYWDEPGAGPMSHRLEAWIGDD